MVMQIIFVKKCLSALRQYFFLTLIISRIHQLKTFKNLAITKWKIENDHISNRPTNFGNIIKNLFRDNEKSPSPFADLTLEGNFKVVLPHFCKRYLTFTSKSDGHHFLSTKVQKKDVSEIIRQTSLIRPSVTNFVTESVQNYPFLQVVKHGKHLLPNSPDSIFFAIELGQEKILTFQLTRCQIERSCSHLLTFIAP